MNLKMLLFTSMSLVFFVSYHNSDDPYMTLATETPNIGTESGLFTADLSPDVYYRVNNDCQTDGSDNHWAAVSSYETQDEITKFTIKVSENSSTSSCVGAIRPIGDDVTPPKLAITQKMIVPKSVSLITELIDATTTESSFKVFGDKEWEAVCTDADVTVSPADGIGECDVKLISPENKTSTKRIIKVAATIQDDTDYTYTLVQDTFSGILADWDLDSLIANTNVMFVDEAQSVLPGVSGKYLALSAGSGKAEYWTCDQTGYVAQSTVCSRAVGDNGDPYVSGVIPDDYWYIYRDMKGTTIPAGTKTHFYFVTKLGTMCSNYQMIGFKDGEERKPALPTSILQESATETLSGAPINYPATITCNFAGMLFDSSSNGIYIPIEGIFTTTKDMDEIVLGFGQAGRLCLSGARYTEKYTDWTHASNQTRPSAQHPNNLETGVTIKEYNQHVLLEIVE